MLAFGVAPRGRPALAVTLVVVLLWLLPLAAAANVLWFVLKAANPLVVSDSWHFIGTVVQPYATGTLELGDLFVKRSALDHSQPLRKLISLMSYEWFDLDFKVEGVVAVIFAFGNLGLLAAMWRRARRDGPVPPSEGIVFVALAAVYLSIGETGVLTWPLVTLNYTAHLFVFGYFWIGWRALATPSPGRLAALLLAGFTTSVVADDTALIATIAMAVTIAVHGWREGRLRASVSVLPVAVSGYLLYAAAYRLISSTPEHGASSLSVGESLSGLLAQAVDVWQWAIPPLVSSVVHRRQLAEWSLEGPIPILAIATVLAVAHLWFWIVAIRVRGCDNPLVFTATAVMLLFYGLVAGIVVARVSEFGVEYLWQPRYALIYRWNLIALLLMALGHLVERSRNSTSLSPAALAPVALAGALLVLQFPLSVAAWRTVPHVVKYQQRQALQIGALALNPDVVPNPCMPGIVVCKFAEDRRRSLVDFLFTQRLNIFAPSVQARTGLRPWKPGDTPGQAAVLRE